MSLSNVLEAYDKSQPESFRHEFCWDDAEVERAREWAAFAGELTTEIHEVLGHGSGRMAEGVTQQPQELLKEQYSALEESRADLVALYFVADPYLAVLGLVPPADQADHRSRRVRGVCAQCAGAAAPRARGHVSSRKTTCATGRRLSTG